MVFIPRHQSTTMQEAYARRVWGAQGESKHDIAINVGYSEAVARSPGQKIEAKPGFQNAIAILAEKSDNVAMKIMSEFEKRDMTDYSNKDLNSALHAIAIARDKFQPKESETPILGTGRLRQVILQKIENQNITNNQSIPIEVKEEVIDHEDF